MPTVQSDTIIIPMKLKSKMCAGPLPVLCFSALIGIPAQAAGLVQLVTANDVGAIDSIQWSSLGGDLTPLSSPVSLATVDGYSAVLGGSSGSSQFTLFSGSTYNADFLPNDTVISAFDSNTFAPLATGMQIHFAVPVLALGAQIQVSNFGPFTGTLLAFDANSVF